MEVWVLEHGSYNQTFIWGVYSTAEKAMATYFDKGGWQQHKDGSWSKGLDWSDTMSLTPHTVDAVEE